MFLNDIFKDHLQKHAIIYLDNIIVYSSTYEQHIKDVKAVLDTLRKEKIYAKTSKCEFFKKEVKFLGHIISSNRIMPDPDKVEAIHCIPRPRNVKEIRIFLGLIAYLRRFIPNYGEL